MQPRLTACNSQLIPPIYSWCNSQYHGSTTAAIGTVACFTGAVPCRAVPCRAVPCRAVPCRLECVATLVQPQPHRQRLLSASECRLVPDDTGVSAPAEHSGGITKVQCPQRCAALQDQFPLQMPDRSIFCGPQAAPLPCAASRSPGCPPCATGTARHGTARRHAALLARHTARHGTASCCSARTAHGTARHGVMLLCSAFGFLGGSSASLQLTQNKPTPWSAVGPVPASL
jgi:hypothetical protein